jgi:hypothetical protein
MLNWKIGPNGGMVTTPLFPIPLCTITPGNYSGRYRILFDSKTNVHWSQSSFILKIGKEKREIIQFVGVRQGDNLALVLFLFLLTAFAELLEKEYESDRNNIKKIELHQASDVDFAMPMEMWYLKANTPKLTYWEAMLFLCKYMMEHHLQLQCRSWYWELLGGFGLEMHLGYKEWEDPTIEDQSVFFPPPQYFDKMEATATVENGTETQREMTIASKWSKESEKTKMSRESACYNLQQNW